MVTKTHKPVVLLLPPPKGLPYDFWLLVNRMRSWLTLRRVLVVSGLGLGTLVAAYATAFFWPRTVAFSYAEQNCFRQPVALPALVSKHNSARFEARPVAGLSLFGYPLYSNTTCLKPTAAPLENTAEVIPFGSGLFQKKIRVTTGAFPVLASQAVLEKPVSTQDPLLLALDSTDNTFEYRLLSNDKSAACEIEASLIRCDTAPLGLAQSSTYDLRLERLFGGAPAGTVLTHSITTVESVHVTASSIAANQMVYDVPTQLTLTLNRPAAKLEGAQLYVMNGEAREAVAAESNLDGQTIAVHFAEPLRRNASFVFSLERVTAADGGFLTAPFSLSFKTSGGPKVLGVSIGSYKVAPNGSIVISFDSPLSKTQTLGDFVKLEAGGNAVAVSLKAQNSKITITPSAALPRCTALTVKVLDGLQNDFGISGGSAWQFKSHSLCQTVFSIGTSVQGRGITGYSFGSGGSKIVFVGGTHGDEKSSVYLLNSWIDYLEANPSTIPAGRTIVIIPNLNPDGYALGRRTNANNVDLNRNFPANNWKQGVTMPDHSYNANGGGSAPLSEPESAALAAYVLAQSPRLVLTYHAAAGVVMPNDSGDSDSLAHVYDQKSNVGYAASSQNGEIFDYDTTGAFEDWLHDSPDLPALLVELWTKSGSEFAKHQNALIAMAQLP